MQRPLAVFQSRELGIKTVQVVTSWEAVRRSRARCEPCIYRGPTGLMRSARDRYTESYFQEHLGSLRLRVHTSLTRRYFDAGESFWGLVRSFLNETCCFAEFLSEGLERGQIVSGTELYVYQNGSAVRGLEALWTELKDVWAGMVGPSAVRTVGLWLSGEGVKTCLHYDTSGDHNLNVQLQGRKRVTLFPPSDWPHLKTALALGLHAMDAYESVSQSSDSGVFGGPLSEASPLIAQLESGDTLLIPSYWFHFVEHLDAFNVNATFWFSRQAEDAVDKHGMGWGGRPGQSCRDFRLMGRLFSAFVMAGVFNGIHWATGLSFGQGLCDYWNDRPAKK